MASGLIFFVDAAGEGDATALVGAGVEVLFVVGEEVFFGALGELLLLGAGVADFSVVTETLGSVAGDSDFSGRLASGVAAGVGLVSSWAHAIGAETAKSPIRARMAVFIYGFPLVWVLKRPLKLPANPIPSVDENPCGGNAS
ncbi:MAG TPA: hypothetical protein VK581_13260 [Chthoniobacterales bacterium]|nr:hypothetical protein [Chthoniobacterales bacterium]